MTSLQLKKLKMYIALRVLLRENPEILVKLPDGNEYLNQLDPVVLLIQTNSDLLDEGNQNLKNKLEIQTTALIDLLLEDESKLRAYAGYIKDNLLIEEIKTSRTNLIKMEPIEQVNYAKMLYGKINDHLSDVERYGLNADTQTALTTSFTQQETLIPEVTNSKKKLAVLRTTLVANYKSADSIISGIDTEVEIIRNSDAQFYAEYKKVRKVTINRDVIELNGQISDAITGTGIPAASISFSLNGNTPIVKKSATKGGFQIKTIEPGIYKVLVSKLGYIDHVETITVTGDAPYSLEVKMEKN